MKKWIKINRYNTDSWLKVDEDGNPMFDECDDRIYEDVVVNEGYVILSDNVSHITIEGVKGKETYWIHLKEPIGEYIEDKTIGLTKEQYEDFVIEYEWRMKESK